MRRMTVLSALSVSIMSLVVATGGAAAADSPGQTELDKAFEARLSATTFDEVGEVIVLCREAMKKGLDVDNETFAKQLLASSLYERGEILARGVLEASRPDPRLAQIRLAALSDLEEAITLDSELPQARVLVARLHLFAGGDLKKARSMLDAVVDGKSAEDDVRGEAYLYRSQLSEGPDERLKDLDEAVRLAPGSALAFRLRAALKLSQNKPADAVADFDTAIRLDPDSAATHEARGLALASQQKWDEAKASLSRAVELFPKASGAILQRGRVNMLAGDVKAAAADADEVLKLVPDMPEALLLRSHAKYATGDKAGALADAESVLKRLPNSPEALRTRITILIGDEQFDQATADLEQLIQVEPEATDLVLQLAAMQTSLKRNRRAVELVDPVIAADPKNWKALRIRGDALLGLGKHREAIAAYDAGLKIEPKDAGLLNNLAWVLSTSPDDAVRDGSRAVELADKACQTTNYRAAHIISTLAAAYAEQGNFAEARKWSHKALEIAADDSERESLRKELASYEAEKPWREEPTAKDEEPSDEPTPMKNAAPKKKPSKASADGR